MKVDCESFINMPPPKCVSLTTTFEPMTSKPNQLFVASYRKYGDSSLVRN